MAFLGMAAGAVASAIGSRLNADHANAQNVENYKNRHQWEVEDLKRAGLNPVLSANSAGSVASAPMANFPDMSSAFGGDKRIDIERDLADSTKDVNAATKAEKLAGVDLMKYQGKQIDSLIARNEVLNSIDTLNSAANINYLNTQSDVLYGKLANETALTGSQMEYFANLGAAALETARARTSEVGSANEYRGKQGSYLDNLTARDKPESNMYNDNPWLPSVEKAVDVIGRVVGIGSKAAGNISRPTNTIGF